MPVSRETLEEQLNDACPERRQTALDALMERVERGEIALPEPGHAVNLHCHTTFSYNGYGYSPACFAWKARCAGLRVAGIVDFDVLDAVDEFLAACRQVGLRGCAGFETRVFVKEFSTREINSPGEPGISYHMGVGFASGRVTDDALLARFKAIAQDRNRSVAARVNAFLDRVQVDYERDVLPLAPNDNATERHLCEAYDLKARAVFPDARARAAFWAGTLGLDVSKMESVLNDAPVFQGMIRAKTMKAGGVGYAKPHGSDFPAMKSVNEFILAAHAIPTLAWLDGTSEGEQAIEELLDLMQADGVAAVNIIPDRNWNIKDPAVKKTKLDHLYKFVELIQSRDLPIVVGTEMNAYGNRFVDDFDAPELRPLASIFLEGAHILYAHTILQAQAGKGYLSDWAKQTFRSTKDKNAFFKKVGETVAPGGVWVE